MPIKPASLSSHRRWRAEFVGAVLGVSMQTITFNAGDTIIFEGGEGRTAFLIVSGSVEVSVGEGSKARALGTLEAGEVFGEMCLIEPGPRSATVKALTDTEFCS